MVPIDYNGFWSFVYSKNCHVDDVRQTRRESVYKNLDLALPCYFKYDYLLTGEKNKSRMNLPLHLSVDF